MSQQPVLTLPLSGAAQPTGTAAEPTPVTARQTHPAHTPRSAGPPPPSSHDRPFHPTHHQSASTTPGAPLDPLCLASYLPPDLASAFGRRPLFAWQAEALSSPGALDGGSLVFTAPTSAGKTAVAEILLLRAVVRTRLPALFVLPFNALCSQKADRLARLFAPRGLRVVRAYDRQTAGADALAGGVGAVVATFERGNALVGRLLEDGRAPGSALSAVVVDEMHMLGDPDRGFLLELMLAKLRVGAAGGGGGGGAPPAGRSPAPTTGGTTASTLGPVPPRPVQVVGMSATLANAPALAAWLGAALYETDFRPVPLTLHVLTRCGDLLDGDGRVAERLDWSRFLRPPGGSAPAAAKPPPPSSDDVDLAALAALAEETVLREAGSALVFCGTRARAQATATGLAKRLAAVRAGEALPERRLGGGDGSDGAARASAPAPALDRASAVAALEALPSRTRGLAECVRSGVAWHSAELSGRERAVVEAAFAGGGITLLAATSTLAAGVNLPVRRVVFRDTFVGRQANRLCAAQFAQIAGRAGRAGIDPVGHVVVLASADTRTEQRRLLTLIAARPRPVYSAFAPGAGPPGDGRGDAPAAAPPPPNACLRRAVFEGIALRGSATTDDIKAFLEALYAWHGGVDPAAAAGGDAARASMVKGVVATLHWLAGVRPGDGGPAGGGVRKVPELGLIKWEEGPAGRQEDGEGGGEGEEAGEAAPSGGARPSPGAAPPAPAAAASGPARYVLTPLGRTAASAGVSPDEALALRATLEAACRCLVLTSPLHCLFVVVPPPRGQFEHGASPPDIAKRIEGLTGDDARVASAVGVDHGLRLRMSTGAVSAASPAADPAYRLYAALALADLVAERPAASVASSFKCSPHALQGLQDAAGGTAYRLARFAREVGDPFSLLADVLSTVERQVSAGVRGDLVALAAIDMVRGARARRLFAAGLRTVKDVADAPEARLRDILAGGGGGDRGLSSRLVRRIKAHAMELAALASAREELDAKMEAVEVEEDGGGHTPATGAKAEVEVVTIEDGAAAARPPARPPPSPPPPPADPAAVPPPQVLTPPGTGPPPQLTAAVDDEEGGVDDDVDDDDDDDDAASPPGQLGRGGRRVPPAGPPSPPRISPPPATLPSTGLGPLATEAAAVASSAFTPADLAAAAEEAAAAAASASAFQGGDVYAAIRGGKSGAVALGGGCICPAPGAVPAWCGVWAAQPRSAFALDVRGGASGGGGREGPASLPAPGKPVVKTPSTPASARTLHGIAVTWCVGSDGGGGGGGAAPRPPPFVLYIQLAGHPDSARHVAAVLAGAGASAASHHHHHHHRVTLDLKAQLVSLSSAAGGCEGGAGIAAALAGAVARSGAAAAAVAAAAMIVSPGGRSKRAQPPPPPSAYAACLSVIDARQAASLLWPGEAVSSDAGGEGAGGGHGSLPPPSASSSGSRPRPGAADALLARCPGGPAAITALASALPAVASPTASGRRVAAMRRAALTLALHDRVWPALMDGGAGGGGGGRAAAATTASTPAPTATPSLPTPRRTELVAALARVEAPLPPIVARLECAGVLVDGARLDAAATALERVMALSASFLRRTASAAAADARAAGGAPAAAAAAWSGVVDPASPTSMSDLLYGLLGLSPAAAPRLRGSATAWSTARSALAPHARRRPPPGPAARGPAAARAVLDWRSAAKVRADCVAALEEARAGVRCSTWRARALWRLTATETGRLSADEPNLQTVPKPTTYDVAEYADDGPDAPRSISVNVRSAIVAPRGTVLLSADYREMELRLAAHLAGDAALIASLTDPSQADPLSGLAARMHGLDDQGRVSPAQRAAAKKVAYGLMYGMGDAALADHLGGVPLEEAAALRAAFLGAAPALAAWLAATCDAGRDAGAVQTVAGRSRRLRLGTGDGDGGRHHGGHATNTVVQGSAADLAKAAMAALDAALTAGGGGAFPPGAARPILQLHDELVLEVDAPWLAPVAAAVRSAMEGVAQTFGLTVPLPVRLAVGERWGEMVGYTYK